MSIFTDQGYTEETKFIVLNNDYGLRKGDIVTVILDTGGSCLPFTNEYGLYAIMYLPGMATDGVEDLEVYEEPTVTKCTEEENKRIDDAIGLHRFQVSLDKDTYGCLELLAKRRGVVVQCLVREALTDYVIKGSYGVLKGLDLDEEE